MSTLRGIVDFADDTVNDPLPNMGDAARHYALVAAAIDYLRDHAVEQPEVILQTRRPIQGEPVTLEIHAETP